MTTSEPPGLMGWWPLNDTDGKLIDRLGQSHGVVAGAEPRVCPSLDWLKPERSLYFRRGTSAVIPNTPGVNVGTGSFTICLWVKTDSYSGDTEVLLDKRVEDSGPMQGWCLSLYNGRLSFQVANKGVCLNFFLFATSGRQREVDGNWHHLAITIGNGGRWYVDGREVGKPFSGKLYGSLSNNIPLTLGRRSDAEGGFFGGDLSDICLYQRALTAEEVYQVYNSVSFERALQSILNLNCVSGAENSWNPVNSLLSIRLIIENWQKINGNRWHERVVHLLKIDLKKFSAPLRHQPFYCSLND